MIQLVADLSPTAPCTHYQITSAGCVLTTLSATSNKLEMAYVYFGEDTQSSWKVRMRWTQHFIGLLDFIPGKQNSGPRLLTISLISEKKARIPRKISTFSSVSQVLPFFLALMQVALYLESCVPSCPLDVLIWTEVLYISWICGEN